MTVAVIAPVSQALTADGASANMVTNISNNLGYIDEISTTIDNVNDSYNFLNQVMNSQKVFSTDELSHIQDEIEQFNVATQLVSKVVSTVVKDVDTLTHMQ